MSGTRHIASFALAALLVAIALPSAASETVMGSDGEILRVRALEFSEVDPSVAEARQAEPVLALEIMRDGVVAERLLVPGTDNPATEDTPFLFFEAASESAFLLWSSPTRGLGTAFSLAWYQNGVWSEIVEVSGNPFATKSSPQFLITRDEFETFSGEGNAEPIRRAIVHLVWWEDNGNAGQVLYSPIVLVNGSYVGANPVFPFENLVAPAAEGTAKGIAIADTLVRRPVIRHGRTPSEIIVGLGNPESDELITVALDVIPGQISSLVDRAGIELIDIGFRGDIPSAGVLAVRIEEFILAEGTGINPTVLEYMARRVRELIAAEGDQIDFSQAGLTDLADRAGIELIDVGFQFQQLAEPSLFARTLLTVETPEFGGGSNGSLSASPHGILAVETGRHSAPEVSAETPTLMMSRDGSSILVAWEGEGSIEYQISGEESWSATRSIPLSESMDSDDAFRLLEEHIRDR